MEAISTLQEGKLGDVLHVGFVVGLQSLPDNNGNGLGLSSHRVQGSECFRSYPSHRAVGPAGGRSSARVRIVVAWLRWGARRSPASMWAETGATRNGTALRTLSFPNASMSSSGVKAMARGPSVGAGGECAKVFRLYCTHASGPSCSSRRWPSFPRSCIRVYACLGASCRTTCLAKVCSFLSFLEEVEGSLATRYSAQLLALTCLLLQSGGKAPVRHAFEECAPSLALQSLPHAPKRL